MNHYPDLEELDGAEVEATLRTENELSKSSREEVIHRARQLKSDYDALLTKAHRQEGWVSFDNIRESLEAAYPSASQDEIRKLASSLSDQIHEQFGQPSSRVKQEDILAASARSETAVSKLASQLTDSEIEQLEVQARECIPAEDIPDNFEDFRAEWLAYWVVESKIQMPLDQAT